MSTLRRPPGRCVVIAVGLVAAVSVPAAGGPVKPAGPPVVRIEVDGRAACTGVVVSRRHVLTAKHCVRVPESGSGSPPRLSVLPAGSDRAAGVERVEEAPASGLSGDLAILVLASELEAVPVALAEAAPSSSDTTVHLQRVTLGPGGPAAHRLLQVSIRARDPGLLYTGPCTCDGDSGAPLLSTMGALVGVASARAVGDCGSGASIFVELFPHLGWLRSQLDVPGEASPPARAAAGLGGTASHPMWATRPPPTAAATAPRRAGRLRRRDGARRGSEVKRNGHSAP